MLCLQVIHWHLHIGKIQKKNELYSYNETKNYLQYHQICVWGLALFSQHSNLYLDEVS